MNWGPQSKIMHFRRLWSFQTWCRKSLAAPSAITVMYVRIKCTRFDTKSTTVITVSCSEERGGSTMKSILSMSHRESGIWRGCNSSTRACLWGWLEWNTPGDSSVNYSLWNMLQPTSRRFLRELDEVPGGNNLHYIYYSVLASLHWVTRVWTMKVC